MRGVSPEVTAKTMHDHSAKIIPKGTAQAEGITIEQDGFFPELLVDDFRNAMRVDTTIENDRLKGSLIEAALKVNNDLKAFADNAEHDSLAEIPADTIDGKSIILQQYVAAVFNEAKASLSERYRDFDSTNSGHDAADKLEMGIDDYRQKSREAVRGILGKPRARVTLL